MAVLSATMSAADLPAVVGTTAVKAAGSFVIKHEQFMLNGQPFVYRAGEIHPARVPKEYWRHRLQMLKAMGLNTVGIYLFWNQIESTPGQFDWTGQADYAEFCRIAKEEGMWVVLRPGPYVCAEWDMGGHPWWLAQSGSMEVRSRDPKYLEPALRYLKEVCRVLAPHQITRGGSIILYQVENEYSKSDQEYLSLLMKVATDNGIEVPLIACNPPGDDGRRLKLNYRDDLFQTVNFGRGNAQTAIATLKKFKKHGPYANGEFYPGWFDSWGRNHQKGSATSSLKDLDWMMTNRISFSIYMAHGGTNFGLWASGGAAPIRPLTTSYDYDAPLNESGQITEKYTLIRDLITKHLPAGETLPPVPAPLPTIAVEPFTLTAVSPVLETTTPAIAAEIPQSMEFYNQGHGAILYRTKLSAGPAADLVVKDIHDFAWVFLNGKKLGMMDRRTASCTVALPELKEPATLDIFVMAMGRGNSGQIELKGVIAPVKRGTQELKGWSVFPMPLDAAQLSRLRFAPGTSTNPAFYRGSFQVATVGDTFLDFRGLGHGVMWVNGHCLGRYWNIGPQQTLYCPGPWLKTGTNEVIILECLETAAPRIAGLKEAILSELHNELDFSKVTYPR